MVSIRFCMIVTLMSLWSSNSVWAQAIQFAPQMFGQDEESAKEGLLSSMKIEIDAMRRVADLPEATVKKLNVAAIQAVEAALKNKPMQPLGRVPQAIPHAGGKPPKEGTLSDEDEEDKAKEEIAPANPLPMIGGVVVPPDVTAIKSTDPWKKVLASLEPDKQEIISSFEKKRAVELRKYRVAAKVQELDDTLILSDAQRTELIELVDSKIGNQLAMQPRNGMFGGGAMVVIVQGQRGPELPKEDLKEILSPVQFAEYEAMLNRQAQGPLNVALPRAGFGKNKKEQHTSLIGFTFLEKNIGLVVESVESDSRADRAGLRPGDIIDRIDDKPILTAIELRRAVALSGKDSHTFQIKREGSDVKIEIPSKK